MGVSRGVHGVGWPQRDRAGRGGPHGVLGPPLPPPRAPPCPGGAGGRWTSSTGRRWSIAGRCGCWSSVRPGGCCGWGAWGSPWPSTSCPMPALCPCPSSPPRTSAVPRRGSTAPSPAPSPTRPSGAEGDGGAGGGVGEGREVDAGGRRGDPDARVLSATPKRQRKSVGASGGGLPLAGDPHPAAGVAEAGGDGALAVRGAPGSTGHGRDSVSLAKRRGARMGSAEIPPAGGAVEGLEGLRWVALRGCTNDGLCMAIKCPAWPGGIILGGWGG